MPNVEIKKIINKEPNGGISVDLVTIKRKAKPQEGLKGEEKTIFQPKIILRDIWGRRG